MTFEDLEIEIIKAMKGIGLKLFSAPGKDYPKISTLLFKGRDKDDWCIKIQFGHTADVLKECKCKKS